MMPHRIGLTGSIGMGKSTTAGLFEAEGVPVWDADAVVHRLYQSGGGGVQALANIVPQAIVDGAVDRAILRKAVLASPALLKEVEAVIHPLVAADRADFIAIATAPIILFDIPLLFETGQASAYDSIVTVTANAEIQRARVLARPGMTQDVLTAILAKQMPDSEKRQRADHVIDTSNGIDAARAQIREILNKIRGSEDA